MSDVIGRATISGRVRRTVDGVALIPTDPIIFSGPEDENETHEHNLRMRPVYAYLYTRLRNDYIAMSFATASSYARRVGMLQPVDMLDEAFSDYMFNSSTTYSRVYSQNRAGGIEHHVSHLLALYAFCLACIDSDRANIGREYTVTTGRWDTEELAEVDRNIMSELTAAVQAMQSSVPIPGAVPIQPAYMTPEVMSGGFL